MKPSAWPGAQVARVIELATPGTCAWYALGSSPAKIASVLLGLVGLAVVVYVVVPVLKALGVYWSAMIEARLPAFRSGAWPSSPPSIVTCLRTCVRYPTAVRTWEANDPDFGRPIAAPLDRCAELLGVDLATIRELAANVEPYLRADGTKVWSLMQLERQLRPEAIGRRRGGYIDRRRTPATDAMPRRPASERSGLSRPAS